MAWALLFFALTDSGSKALHHVLQNLKSEGFKRELESSASASTQGMQFFHPASKQSHSQQNASIVEDTFAHVIHKASTLRTGTKTPT